MLIIKNLTRSKIDKKFLQLVVEKSLEGLPGFKKNIKKIEIELVIIGEKRMKELNRIWRGKDKATDVLSFKSTDEPNKNNLSANGFKFILPPDNIINLGQIFICYPVAVRQARQYDYPLREEFARLLVHGILHFAGYDHEKSAKEEKKMFEMQEKILKQV